MQELWLHYLNISYSWKKVLIKARVVVLPVDCVRKLEDLQSITLSITDPPAVSKWIQVSDHCPIWLHILIAGDPIVVSAQSSDIVPVGTGQYDLWWKERDEWINLTNQRKTWVLRFQFLPARLLPSKRTVSPKSVVSWTCIEFIVIVKPSIGLRGGVTRSPFT